MIKQNLFRCFLASLLFMFAWTAYAASLDALLHHANDPILGDPEGPITVVEFFDYDCGHCSNMAPIMANIIRANPRVRFVFKDYPILGNHSKLASRFAIAASYQDKDKYEAFHQALYSSKLNSKDAILKEAESLGLDVKQLQKDMQSRRVTNQLKENISLAKTLEISGTPAFFIGKTDANSNRELNYILGELSESELQAAITKASS